MGVELEQRSWWGRRRVAEIDAVAIGVAAKTDLEACDVPFGEGLDGVGSLADSVGDGLRACPEGGRQAAFMGKGSYDGVQRDVGEQAERAVDAGFATSIRAGDDAQLSEG